MVTNKKKVQGDFKAGSLVTVSMEDLTQNLTITIADMPAIMTAGPNRRQASFLLRKPNKRALRVVVASENGTLATFSKIKLEHGGAFTSGMVSGMTNGNHAAGNTTAPQSSRGLFARLKSKLLR